MGKVLHGYRFIDDETRKALDLPENVYDVTIKANAESAVRVECLYFATLGDPEKHAALMRRLKTFVLCEVADEEIETITDVEVERDGDDPMTPDAPEEDDDDLRDRRCEECGEAATAKVQDRATIARMGTAFRVTFAIGPVHFFCADHARPPRTLQVPLEAGHGGS